MQAEALLNRSETVSMNRAAGKRVCGFSERCADVMRRVAHRGGGVNIGAECTNIMMRSLLTLPAY